MRAVQILCCVTFLVSTVSQTLESALEIQGSTVVLLYKSIFRDNKDTTQREKIEATKWMSDKALDTWIEKNEKYIKEERDSSKNLLIHRAVAYPKYKNLALKLIEKFSQEETKEKNIMDITPLDFAVSASNYKLTGKLLKKGAEITAQTLLIATSGYDNHNFLDTLLRYYEDKTSEKEKIKLINTYPIVRTYIRHRTEKKVDDEWQEDKWWEEKLKKQKEKLSKDENLFKLLKEESQKNRKTLSNETKKFSIDEEQIEKQWEGKQMLREMEERLREEEFARISRRKLREIQHHFEKEKNELLWSKELLDIEKKLRNIKKLQKTKEKIVYQKELGKLRKLQSQFEKEKKKIMRSEEYKKLEQEENQKIIELWKNRFQFKTIKKKEENLSPLDKLVKKWKNLFEDEEWLNKAEQQLKRDEWWLKSKKKDEEKRKQWEEERKRKKAKKEGIILIKKDDVDPSKRYLEVKEFLNEGPILHQAVKQRLSNITNVLLKHGANPDIQGYQNRTPLHYAVISYIKRLKEVRKLFGIEYSHSVELVQLLLDADATIPTQPDIEGKTAFDYALKSKNDDLLVPFYDHAIKTNNQEFLKRFQKHLTEAFSLKMSLVKLKRSLEQMQKKLESLASKLGQLKESLSKL